MPSRENQYFIQYIKIDPFISSSFIIGNHLEKRIICPVGE
jgi:hypothetical protein